MLMGVLYLTKLILKIDKIPFTYQCIFDQKVRDGYCWVTEATKIATIVHRESEGYLHKSTSRLFQSLHHGPK